MAKKKAKAGGTLKIFIVAIVVILIIALGFTGLYYHRYFSANVTGNKEYLYIHTGATFNDVFDTVKEDGIVKDSSTFYWAAQNMNYLHRVKPGRYRLHEGMGNRKLINMLA